MSIVEQIAKAVHLANHRGESDDLRVLVLDKDRYEDLGMALEAMGFWGPTELSEFLEKGEKPGPTGCRYLGCEVYTAEWIDGVAIVAGDMNRPVAYLLASLR